MESEIEWNQEEIMKLINHYRNQPVLWNHTISEFKDKNKKHEAWKYIARHMRVSKAEAQNKMRNLISQFHREIRKTKSGAEEAKIKWSFYGPLLFLKDKTTSRHARDSSITEEETRLLVDEPAGTFCSTSVNVENNDQVERLYASNSSAPPPMYSSRLKRRYNQAEESSSIMNESGRTDEFDAFGAHVAWQVRKLTDKRDQALAKYRINKLLFELEMSQVTSRNNQPEIRESPNELLQE